MQQVAVEKLDKKTGQALARYISVVEATRENNIPYHYIWRALNNPKYSCGGYKWRRVNGERKSSTSSSLQ